MPYFRQIQPPLSPFSARTEVPVESRSLKNGASMFLINAGTEDVMRIEFVFRAGVIQEYLPLLATTTNMMLTEGSEMHSAEELNSILDYYGIFLNLAAERDTAGLTVYFLNKHIEKVIELINEILFHPSFPEKELDTLMNKRLSWHRINMEKVQNLANDQFFESLFGSHHPYGRKLDEKDFKIVTPHFLKDFHSKYYAPEKMAVIVSGRIHEKAISLIENYLGNIYSRTLFIEDPAGFLNGATEKWKHIKKEGAIQTALRIGSPTINKRHPDYPGLKILNVILGGYFGSRLMKNIREEKGFTYGIHSSVSSLDLCGFKVITTEVGKANTEEAIREIHNEIKLLQSEPISNDELEVVRNYMAGEMVRMFDGPFAIAESFKAVWEFGLDFNYFKGLMDSVRTITPDEITRLAKMYYNIDDLYHITAG